MRTFLLLATVVAYAKATGYYYQEASSRSSSSSYKNNELQHQTEDESYYSKRGDTEGRAAPKVNTYSQHLQYKNPNRQDYVQPDNTPDDSDTYAARQAVGSEGIVRTVSGNAGNRDQYSYRATYGVSPGGEITPLHGGSYDTQSNLLGLTQRLQSDLSRQLQSAITTQKRYDSNVYVESEFTTLENELKANLSRQLQEELQRQYGSQVSRGSHSYSIKNGRYSTEANYNTQELDDLKSQLEQSLLQQLRNQYQTSSSSSSSSSYYSAGSAGQTSRGHTSMYRPTYEAFPSHPEVRPVIPLTDVLSQVQATVDGRLNSALDRVEHQYLTEDVTYNDVPNFDAILENLKDELKRNLTSIIESTLIERYGHQEEHNNYYYTSRNVATGSRVANYKLDDLLALKQQVENNLIQKLGNTIQQQRQTYQTNRQNYSQQRQTHNVYRPDSPKVYTSYVVFQPSVRPDTTYSQSHTENVDNTYVTREDQSNSGPVYRPVVDNVRPDTTYSQTHTENVDNTYVAREDQSNSRPVYRPVVDNVRPDTTYSQSHTENVDNTYVAREDQSNSRPAYRPVVDNVRPIRYGTYQPGNYYPSSASHQTSTSNQNQDSQRTEQLEYGYNPTAGQRPSSGSPPSGSRTTYYPSSSGTSYPTGTVHYPYPSGGGGSTYQTNYQTGQQSSSGSSYNAVVGRREGGIEYTPTVTRPQVEYQAELLNIRDQVQNDISRQLNTAIQQQRESSSSSSSTYSTSSSTANSQILNELSDELKRNLTKKVEQALTDHYGRTGVRGGYSVTFSTGGKINPGNYNREQLTTLMNQLQEDLLRQLREGLASESYRQSGSLSSSGSSYEPVRSQGSYGTNAYRTYSSGSYRQSYSGGQGECCVQSDDSTTIAQDGVGPERGDLGKNDDDSKKLPDEKSPKVDIEAIPPENVETSTAKLLARDKPSNKPTQRVPEDDLEQQNVEDLNQQFLVDQDNLRDFDQLTEDQNQFEGQEQNSGITQQTVDEFGQHSDESEIVQQTVQHRVPSRDFPRRYQNVEHYSQQETNRGGSRIEQTHQTGDLTSNTYQQQNQFLSQERGLDLTQQHTDDLTQQNEDLTQQHTEDLTQQNEDLTQQHTDDFTQQNEDLTQQSQTHDLTQQTEDLTQQLQHISQQSYSPSQTHYLTQQSQDLEQQTQDLSQQSYVPAQNQDLTQQTQDLSHIPIEQQSVPQQTEDLARQTADITQQTQDLSQQTQDLSQQTQDLSRQFADLFEKSEQEIARQQNPYQNREPYGRIVAHRAQSSSSSYSSSQNSDIHYASIGEVPLQKASDLEQQHVEEQRANVVQDVSHQVRDVDVDAPVETFEQVETITTTEKPGFWKKLGGKITKTYNKAKDSILSVG